MSMHISCAEVGVDVQGVQLYLYLRNGQRENAIPRNFVVNSILFDIINRLLVYFLPSFSFVCAASSFTNTVNKYVTVYVDRVGTN